MKSSLNHILQRQTRLIATLCGIILVLLFVIFLLGYCQPQHERQNALQPTPASGSATTTDSAAASPP